MSLIIFDTSVASLNAGDFIIMDAVKKVLDECFPSTFKTTLPTHERISKIGRRLISNSNITFVGGTNLLTGNVLKYHQWKLHPQDLFVLSSNVVLLGVGWWQYQNDVSQITSLVYKKIFSNKFVHSVRDSYTEKKLKSIGLKNVINTSCPTMWGLTKKHCLDIPSEKGEAVVFTLTDYNRDFGLDLSFIKMLLKEYKNVFFWPQGSNDQAYFKSLEIREEIKEISPNLRSYDSLLNTYNGLLDYVGTRLHAGIRALQHKRRSIIIGIDNRAEEKSKDFNIRVCSRKNIQQLHKLLLSEFSTKINLPVENINRWKNQFK